MQPAPTCRRCGAAAADVLRSLDTWMSAAE